MPSGAMRKNKERIATGGAERRGEVTPEAETGKRVIEPREINNRIILPCPQSLYPFNAGEGFRILPF